MFFVPFHNNSEQIVVEILICLLAIIVFLHKMKRILITVVLFQQDNITISKKDFLSLFDDINLKKDDFVYFDPPYSVNTATYNENDKWSVDDNLRLFNLCKELDNQGIKFGMSNVFMNKGIENTLLKEFCQENNFSLYSPNSFQYHAFGKENKKQQEVFISNYKIKNKKHNFSQVYL